MSLLLSTEPTRRSTNWATHSKLINDIIHESDEVGLQKLISIRESVGVGLQNCNLTNNCDKSTNKYVF